jgi:hypothetical protein
MATATHDTKTINGLLAMFFEGARARDQVYTHPNARQFTLTARQFNWLCDVAQREEGDVQRSRGARVVQAEIVGVGVFDALEQKGGSATVTIRGGA